MGLQLQNDYNLQTMFLMTLPVSTKKVSGAFAALTFAPTAFPLLPPALQSLTEHVELGAQTGGGEG